MQRGGELRKLFRNPVPVKETIGTPFIETEYLFVLIILRETRSLIRFSSSSFLENAICLIISLFTGRLMTPCTLPGTKPEDPGM